MSTRRTTKQLLSTNGFAYWDRVQTGFAFTLNNCLFPARTGRDNFRRKGTFSTWPRMAKFRTVVVPTTELSVTNGLTAESSLIQVVNRTRHQFLFLSTMTFVFQGFLTFFTRTTVALPLTGVNSTVQGLCTCGLAYNLILLAALHWLSGSSASTTPLNHCLTWGTRPRVAQQSTRMVTQLLPATNFPTGVGNITSIVLRIPLLPTKTVVLSGNLLGHVLTRRASPTIVGLRTAGPFGRTGQMQDMIAVRTRPNGLRWPHQITTNKTLQFGGIQLPDELLALRALGNDLCF